MFFKKSKIIYPHDRGLYAFTQYRRGDFLLFLEEPSPEVLKFMQLPDRYTLSLTLQEFTEGIQSKLLDFVEQIPLDVFEVAQSNQLNLEKSS